MSIYVQSKRLKQPVYLLLMVFSLTMPLKSMAGSADWSSTNFQYLYGTDYNTGLGGKDTRSIFTLEHVNGWKYGDNFFFLDTTNPTRTGTSNYAEYSPRISFGKVSGNDLSIGIIKDFLLTATLEAGNGFHNNLYGIAVDLDIPGFSFFQVNWYIRDEATANDEGYQVTLAWGYPFKLGSADMTFEGFFDYAYGLEKSEDNIVTAPRLLVDVGKFFGKPGVVQAGVEYQIWDNQFGVKGQDEDVAQFMVKWIF